MSSHGEVCDEVERDTFLIFIFYEMNINYK